MLVEVVHERAVADPDEVVEQNSGAKRERLRDHVAHTRTDQAQNNEEQNQSDARLKSSGAERSRAYHRCVLSQTCLCLKRL